MKKLIEITNEAASKVFQCEKVDDGEAVRAEVDLPLQGIIDAGISAAIPRALYLKMDKDPKEEVTIQVGPFTYGVTMRKSGSDAISFNPTFNLTDEKKLLSELAEYEDSPGKLIDSLIKPIAATITDEVFLDTVIHSCKLDEYDTTKGEWVEKVNDADKGVELDNYTAKLFVAIHVVSILHVLANSRDSEEIVKYEVPGEGTYTIQKVKDKYQIGFVASKEFKQAIKNDRLADSVA